MIKAALRQELLNKRRAIPPERRAQALERFKAAIIDMSGLMGAYAATGTELDILPLLNDVALPRVQGDQLEYVHWDHSPLVPGPFNILEPAGPAMPNPPPCILVPCLGGTRDGWRLGYGAGYFDRFLAAHPNVQTIGILFEECLLETFAPEPFDRPLTRMFIL